MKKLIVLSVCFIVFLNCKENNPVTIESKDSKEAIDNNNIEEKFEVFLNKFLNDSIFRYDRVSFPIRGFNSDAEEKRDNYKWVKEDWDYYFEQDAKYKDDKSIVSQISSKDSTATWRLYIKNSGYDVNYHFRKDKGKWYLKLYSYKNF